MRSESRQCCFLLLSFVPLGKMTTDIWRLMAAIGNDSATAAVTPHVGQGGEPSVLLYISRDMI